MNNIFPLDTIRAIIEQTLLEEHNANPTKYFGGSNQVNLFSFYEQLQKDSEVNRYVEIYQDLVEQQNRSGLIMNGTIIAPENPTITNLYLDTIIPMSFTCSFRVTLGDRDKAITTINNLIEKLKGRKQDVALFEKGQILKVGCIANDSDIMFPTLKNGDYIGEKTNSLETINDFANDRITYYMGLGVANNTTYPQWYYYEDSGLLKVVYKASASDNFETIIEHNDILFAPSETFEKYKVSMSFDSIRCDEPRNLNAKEYCTISFGGSATLVNNGVALGNDLVKLGISKNKIVAQPIITINQKSQLLANATWLEPLEMPSGNNANTITNIINSHKFNTNSHTTNITIANQYSFVLDRSISFLNQLFKYARYGYFGVEYVNGIPSYNNAITPNMVFRVFEVYSSWGLVEINHIDTKLVEDIDIENTESDTMSITFTMQKETFTTYDINANILNGTYTGSDEVIVNETATLTIVPNEYCLLPETIQVSNATYTYDNETGVVEISNPLDNVILIAECVAPYSISGQITNGTYSGDTMIYPNDTATITITPNEGRYLPSSISVYGADYTYNKYTGVVELSNARANVIIFANCRLAYPTKGSVITFEAKNNTTHRFLVMSINNSNGQAKLLDLTENSGTLAYNITNTTTQFEDNQYYQKYENSNIDNYLNNTYYNSLKENVRSAIIDTTIRQDAWYMGDGRFGQLSQYDIKIYSKGESSLDEEIYTYKKKSSVNVGNRKCFALKIDDIIAFYNWTTPKDINGDVLNSLGLSSKNWLMDAGNFIPLGYGNNGGMSLYLLGIFGSRFEIDISTWTSINKVAPVFNINLEIIDYEIEV